MLPQADRIAFSLKIVSADTEIAAINTAQSQLKMQVDALTDLDAANKNLFDSPNALVNQYQQEYAYLDGITRTTITEQDIQDAANRKLQNHFFPNDISVSVPSLSAFHNVWVKAPPYALNFGIGKTYSEAYPGTITKEEDTINAALALIASATAYLEIELTTGQTCNEGGSCSLPMYLTQATCIAATPTPGVWTPAADVIGPFAAVQTLKANLVTAINTVKTFLQTEVATVVTTDKDATNQGFNNAAINNINNVIIPAINTWLAYNDFNTAHGQTTCIGFFAYDPNLLAPTKLHSNQLTALSAALTARLSYLSTRITQLSTTILGALSQDVNTGIVTGTGLYVKRYGFLALRLNAFTGSLSQLASLKNANNAQDAIKGSILQNKTTYNSILPTSALAAPANGTNIVPLVDASFLSVGDTVYVYAEGQEELVRGIKSINGNSVTLSDVVPAKYRNTERARLYKDIS